MANLVMGGIEEKISDDQLAASGPSSQHRQALLFRPKFFQEFSRRSFDHIPTYLFRLYADCTVGTTSTTEVASPAWERGYETIDLFELPPQEAASCLSAHFTWRRWHETRCNLMSWSCSLLFVLQHGFRRHYTNELDLADVHLLTLDTRKFPPGCFARELDLLRDFEDFEESEVREGKLTWLKGLRGKGMYFGEYVTQEHLDVAGQCSQTSLKQLNDMGLQSLCPLLYSKGGWEGLAKRVVEIREDFNAPAAETDKKDIRIAISMAQACFGSCWALPFAAMLLSLRHREHNSPTIQNGITSIFTDEEIASLDIDTMKFDPLSDSAPELRQYRNIMLTLGGRESAVELDKLFKGLRVNA